MTGVIFVKCSKLWADFLNIATATFTILYSLLMVMSIIEKRSYNTSYIRAIFTITGLLALSRIIPMLKLFSARTDALIVAMISLLAIVYMKLKLNIKDKILYAISLAIALISIIENLINPSLFLSIAIFLVSCYLFIRLFSLILFPGVAEKICILYMIFVFISGYTVVTLISNYQSQVAVKNMLDAKKASSAFMFRLSHFKRLLKSALLMKETRRAIINPSEKSAALHFHLLKDLYKSDVVYFMDTSGTIRISSTPGFTGKNLSFRVYFKQALTGKPCTYVARGVITNVTGLFFAFPYWYSGKIIGVMVFKYSFNLIIPTNIFQGNFLLIDKSGLVIEGPKKFVDTCIYCKEELLTKKLKEKILGRATYKGRIFVLKGQNLICNKEDSEECYIAVISTIPNTDYRIVKIAPLSIITSYERGILLTWVVFNLLVVIVFVEIQEWSTLMSYDPLTSFFNRETLMIKLNELFARSRRTGSYIHILMIDLDRFKKVNDTYGHPIGDVVLKSVAEIVRGCLRPYDVMGRYGGEEFLVAFESTDPEAGRVVAERIRSQVEAHTVRAGKWEIKVTVSVGVKTICCSGKIAGYREVAGFIERCIEEADEALYMAKSSGRNKVAVAS